MEVRRGATPVVLGLRRERLILGVLVLWAGQAVALNRLIEVGWFEQTPPLSARNAIHVCISKLRTILGDAAHIVTVGDGYRIDLDHELVDVFQFRALVAAARDLDDDARAATLRDAEALWRGPVLACELSDEARQRLCGGLDEERIAAVEERIAAELALGRHRQLISELTDLVRGYPTRERMLSQLMLALYRDGQSARALELCQRTKAFLADELGIDPGPEIRDLEVAILRQDPDLHTRPATEHPTTVGRAPLGSTPAGRPPVPSQLPLDVYGFTGREPQLGQLDHVLDHLADQPTAMRVAALSGTAGVGKTTLAVHWAHRVAGRFPDGQLYVNLRGFDPGRPAVSPHEALQGFLAALGEPPGTIPRATDALAALYRSRLAGRRMLVVLDNARDAAHIRPLLPGSSGCVVVVTSRNQLTGLVATEGAHAITLDVLTDAEATELLMRRLGEERVRAEPDAAADIVARCARLPLALAIATARAAGNPQFRLDTTAGQLRDAHGSLEAFATGDEVSDIRAVFSWSYNALAEDSARMFRLLGLHRGQDMNARAAASLAAVSLDETNRLLADLTRAHLMTEHTPGRFTFHDLLRAYANELVRADPQRPAATARMLDYHLHTAWAGNRILVPHRPPESLGEPAAGTVPEHLVGREDTIAWLRTEHRVLLSSVEEAAAEGRDGYAWRMASYLADYLHRQGHWREWIAVQTIAVGAAERAEDWTGLVAAQSDLALVLIEVGRYEEARTHLRHATDLCRLRDDRRNQAVTSQVFGVLYERQGKYQDSLEHLGAALDLYVAEGDPSGQGAVHNNMGWLHTRLGNYEQALVACRRALAFHEGLGDLNGQAAAWDTLGYTHQKMSDHPEAVRCYGRALDLRRRTGERYPESGALTHLGDAHHAAGDTPAALATWHRALDILEALDHPDAERIRSRIGSAREGRDVG